MQKINEHALICNFFTSLDAKFDVNPWVDFHQYNGTNMLSHGVDQGIRFWEL